MKHIIKIFMPLLLFFISNAQYPAFAQSKMAEQISNQSDSIFNLIIKETDANKKVKLTLSLYSRGIDGYPLQLQRLSQKMLDLAIKNNNQILESSAWSSLGQAYRITGDYVKGLECHRKGLALAEKSGNLLLLAMAQNQMGHIYKDRQENDKALSLYKSSMFIAEKINERQIMHWPYGNIGAVYLNMGNLDSALHYMQISRSINVNSKYISANNSLSYTTLATIYSRKGDLAKARDYFEQANQINNRSLSARYTNQNFVAMAEHFKFHRQYDSAIYFCKAAVEVVQNTELSHMALKPARMLIDFYQNTNADSTVKYWKLYSAQNDSLNSTRANQQIQMMTFEEDQRKRDIEAAKIEYQNKIRTGMLLGGLGIFSLLAFVLYRNNRQKQKANHKLEKTLAELQSTQAQLIQSEKMASLGELTAGIAHEIQNPLNFVNNFSDVSTELVDEMNSEIIKGNLEDAKQIAQDLKQNLEKINHHGKRAGDIVKGMLQHSRSSNGVKEPTDINALCDEYLRLSYHGLRAKDKSFNATMKTDFDASIGNINMIPQDIGRVVLNLINNAFYVVDEKRKSGSEGYEPTVSVSTKKVNGKVEIKVSDNGNGIPQKVLDKIFQPFFTTKPTGQGTGLGLSLSYDIVKAHGGELKVETKEGEGSEFIIQLPIVKEQTGS
jgi:two-component system, NtrC family, sensor kinase